MKNRLKWATALIACVSLVCTTSAQAQQRRNYRDANDAAEMAGASLASYNNVDDGDSYGTDLGDYSSYDEGSQNSNYIGGYSGGGGGILSRPGQFFVGADYLSIRATFSESTAFVVQTGGYLAPPALAPPVVNTFQELDYGYASSYRVFGGYRLNDCGGEIRFAFTNFGNIGANAVSPAAVVTGTNTGDPVTQILHPGELAPSAPGDRLVANSNVNAKIYDLGFAKTIPLGSPASGGSDSCTSGCDTGCGWCPAWDIKWSAGLRFAQVNWDRQTTHANVGGGNTTDVNSTTMDFEGGGARVGLEGTRYLGRQQRFALFARGDMSLLLGTVDLVNVGSLVQAGATVPSPGTTTVFSSTQLIPVFDIEAGGTFFVTDRLTVSGGYLLSAWSDLGMRDTFDTLAGQGPMFDDANILGFDGFFVRSEFAF